MSVRESPVWDSDQQQNCMKHKLLVQILILLEVESNSMVLSYRQAW